MSDEIRSRPDHQCLFDKANGHHGFFTAAQACDCGFSRSLLAHQTKAGKCIRVRRGLYRLRAYPSFHHEGVMAAWLTLGKDASVVSHESALELLELSDVIPHFIHLTVPRSRRNLPDLAGVKVHTTSRPFGPRDIVVLDGIRMTSAGRSILDSAEAGTALEQVEMAIRQALERGLVTKQRLMLDATTRSQRVQGLVSGALS